MRDFINDFILFDRLQPAYFLHSGGDFGHIFPGVGDNLFYLFLPPPSQSVILFSNIPIRNNATVRPTNQAQVICG